MVKLNIFIEIKKGTYYYSNKCVDDLTVNYMIDKINLIQNNRKEEVIRLK